MGRPKQLTADEWDACTYPGTMLPHLRTGSPRKLRLFVCSCCRRIWDMLFDVRSKAVVEAAELWADGQLTLRELKPSQLAGSLSHQTPAVVPYLHSVMIPDHYSGDRRYYYAARAARSAGILQKVWVVNTAWAAREASPNELAEERVQCDLLRCIFGSPFRPVAFDPRWRTETTLTLAAGIYAERAFDRMPVLADALEEAGCDHADMLAHCRDPKALHARGCWVVDLVLNKS